MRERQSSTKVTKRQALKAQRERRQRQQRLTMILVIAGIALAVAALLIYPSLRNSLAPVGEFVRITPDDYPQADGTALGDPNAPVLIEVYEDFQCPACQGYSEEIESRVIENYVQTGQVHYVFRHYPFLDDQSTAKESDQAANASMCAAEQGRFWDYKQMLFANWDGENQGAFADNRLIAFAEALNLDMDSFRACFEENRYQDEINEDLAAGESAGVSGTPSVFVNGKIVKPGFVPSFEDIQQAVEAELASSSQ